MVEFDGRQREAVLAYCGFAAASGAALYLNDLLELMSVDATAEELGKAISADEYLGPRLTVESGLVLLRQAGSNEAAFATKVEEAEKKRKQALANIEEAKKFARFFTKDSLFVAVAGTTSYLSATVNDDIDFYIVTKTNGMWSFMLRALILSRLAAQSHPSIRPFCFSFVMDERKWKEEFSKDRGPLSARDTLTSKVISGLDSYHEVLERAGWMESHFPKFYQRRLMETRGTGGGGRGKSGSRVVNELLFLTLGTYVSLKAWALNRRLASQGRSDAVFVTRIAPDRLEYASRRYLNLGKMYQALEKP